MKVCPVPTGARGPELLTVIFSPAELLRVTEDWSEPEAEKEDSGYIEVRDSRQVISNLLA